MNNNGDDFSIASYKYSDLSEMRSRENAWGSKNRDQFFLKINLTTTRLSYHHSFGMASPK